MLARLAPLAACAFVVASDGTLVVGLLSRIGRGIAASPAAAGQGITVFAIAYAFVSPLLVVATRRWPSKRVLLVGLFAFVVANVATGAAGSLAGFLAARLLAGLSAGVVTPTAAIVASASSSEAERGRALAVVVGGASVAAVVGVPIGTAFGVYLGWRVPFFAVAVLGLVLIGLLVRQRLPRDGKASVRTRLRGRHTAIGLTVTVTLLWSAGSFAFFSYLTLVLRSVGVVAGFAVAAELMLFGAAGVVGAYFSGKLTDRRGALNVAVVALVTLTVSQVGFALVAASRLGGTQAAALGSVLVAFYAVATWAVTPPQQHRLLGLAPDAMRMVLSLNATALYAGVAVGSAAGGAVIATTHSVVALCLVAAALCFAGVLALVASSRVTSS